MPEPSGAAGAAGARAPVGLVLLALASLAVPIAEALTGAILARGALAALALLPWLALATLPRRSAAPPSPSCDGPLAATARATAVLAAPLALAAGLDLARGAPPAALARATLAGLVALCAWIAAAHAAADSPRARAVHGGAWLVLVPGLAALELALEWVPLGAASAGTRAPSALAHLFPLGPLVALRRWGAPGGLAEPSAQVALSALAAVLVLAGTLALRRRTGAPG